MNKQELAQELLQFAEKAFVDIKNIETGFLTRHLVNPLTKEQILYVSSETENIVTQLVEQMEKLFSEKIPEYFDCGTLFQYIFDKVTEVVYKMIMGNDIDTQFGLKEAFAYHEPDLPEYIQLKLTNVVGQTAIISSQILSYLDEKKIRTVDLSSWMIGYLMVAAVIAIQFAQEIDPNDDSEMQAYLNR
ncbi:MAG: hypothetical protein J5588_02090 [Bacteroidales bacterium]|nr:hypothetical protein [Bacteroidales bacterium]